GWAGQLYRKQCHHVRRLDAHRDRSAQPQLRKGLVMQVSLQSRNGMALIMALGAMVIIGVLIGGILFVTTQDYRIGTNTMRQEQATAAADLGLNRVPQEWNLADNTRLKTGDTLKRVYPGLHTASAKVIVTRLTGPFFWVVSEGTAGGLGSQASARSRPRAKPRSTGTSA